ncbi:MAG: 4-(cytidine 5'-diphospho)-2-C-methyl-D-erythritol kinase [Sneathiella sp.]|nr:4-(cytidine 5'-diphospho)-2-C-methyl-D-erythritol kinase [Sneathiella sp.]
MTLSRLAKAKVNLCLHITGRRDDGYHLLESLVCFPECGDVLDVRPSDQLSLREAGPFAGKMGPWQDNLILKAAELLRRQYGVVAGAEIHINKILPVASGIGGGSSDAATVLHLLGKLWSITISDSELMKLGAELGADLPICLYGDAAIMSGIGEVISPVKSIPSLGILLVNQGVHVSTQDIFRSLGPIVPKTDLPKMEGLCKDAFIQALNECRNDLQAGAVRVAPSIGTVLAKLDGLDGCLLSRMSGSGATCFGLFDTVKQAESAKEAIQRTEPGWWLSVSHI